MLKSLMSVWEKNFPKDKLEKLAPKEDTAPTQPELLSFPMANVPIIIFESLSNSFYSQICYKMKDDFKGTEKVNEIVPYWLADLSIYVLLLKISF